MLSALLSGHVAFCSEHRLYCKECLEDLAWISFILDMVQCPSSIFSLKIFYVCKCLASVKCLCAHMCRVPKKGIGFPGTRVIDGYKPMCRC